MCGFILLQVACGAAFAQGAEAPAAASAPAMDAAKDSGPFGGCEPIGMTASGELVFPLECKHKIKLPAAPVASEEQAPAAADKPPSAAEAKPAATDDKPAPTPEKAAVEDHAAVETKAAAAVEDKPAPVSAAPVAADAKPTATSEVTSATDKTPAAAAHGPVEAKPAEQAAPKAASEKPAKQAGRRAATKVVNAGKQPVPKQPVAKQVVAMVKSLQAIAGPSHAAQQAGPVQTASVSACMHFRSYNPVSKSYLGFDGHQHICR